MWNLVWCKFVIVCQSFFITAAALVTSYCMRGFIQCPVKWRQLKVSHELFQWSFSVIDISLLSECVFVIFLWIIFEDIPISMCLWWNGSHNLLQYLLLKKEKGTPAAHTFIMQNTVYSYYMDPFVLVYKWFLNLFLNQTVNPDPMFCGPILRRSFALLSVSVHGSLF